MNYGVILLKITHILLRNWSIFLTWHTPKETGSDIKGELHGSTCQTQGLQIKRGLPQYFMCSARASKTY